MVRDYIVHGLTSSREGFREESFTVHASSLIDARCKAQSYLRDGYRYVIWWYRILDVYGLIHEFGRATQDDPSVQNPLVPKALSIAESDDWGFSPTSR